MLAKGILIPLFKKIVLLFIADKYCKMETCPNLEWILVNPKKTLFSLSIEMYGKWYSPASGLLTLLLIISRKVMKDEIIKKKRKFLFMLNFILKRKIITTTQYTKVFVSWFNGKKKFKTNAMKENVTAPTKKVKNLELSPNL